MGDSRSLSKRAPRPSRPFSRTRGTERRMTAHDRFEHAALPRGLGQPRVLVRAWLRALAAQLTAATTRGRPQWRSSNVTMLTVARARPDDGNRRCVPLREARRKRRTSLPLTCIGWLTELIPIGSVDDGPALDACHRGVGGAVAWAESHCAPTRKARRRVRNRLLKSIATRAKCSEPTLTRSSLFPHAPSRLRITSCAGDGRCARMCRTPDCLADMPTLR